MNCEQLHQRLDEYLDGLIEAAETAAIDAHVQDCDACRATLARERALREALRGLPAPEPSEAFFDRAIAQAIDHDRRHHRRRWAGLGGALAAGFALALAFNVLLGPGPGTSGNRAPHDEIPGLSIALDEVREVSLVFESRRALDDATFTVLLPEGVELAGFPGQREVRWHGRLARGRNLLVLPVEARGGQGGELVAYVDHAGRRKTFRLRMEVTSPRNSGINRPIRLSA